MLDHNKQLLLASECQRAINETDATQPAQNSYCANKLTSHFSTSRTLHRCMQPIATDDTCSMVCVSVCLCVHHMDMSCRNGSTDLDAVWGKQTLVGPRNHY